MPVFDMNPPHIIWAINLIVGPSENVSSSIVMLFSLWRLPPRSSFRSFFFDVGPSLLVFLGGAAFPKLRMTLVSSITLHMITVACMVTRFQRQVTQTRSYTWLRGPR